ncbi:MAG TPA: hypothetical protein VFB30_05920 [Spirochaetia bacterium]|nr:hypothetical protein [Spirochaetia bacterium]
MLLVAPAMEFLRLVFRKEIRFSAVLELADTVFVLFGELGLAFSDSG